MKAIAGKYLAALAFGLLFYVPGTPAADDETELLRQQIEQMQRQLEHMQQRLSELEAERDRERETADELKTRLAVVEETAEEEGDDGDGIHFGGLVRTNYAWRDYDDQNKDRVGDFELEVFGVNAKGEIGDVMLDAQWRRYNDFHAIHHAWLGYRFSERTHMELGITQVPFGILPWASHSFWFGGTYYLGYEDDYDTGIKFVQSGDDWTFHYAFFKNPEYANDGRFGRYSFDLVTDGDQQNTEDNQVNFRAERHLDFGGDKRMDAGLSLQAGQIYNRATEKHGDRWAVAGHVNSNIGPWNLQLQAMRYQYNPKNPEGVSEDFVQKGAFNFPFLMAAEGNVYSANVARAIDVDWGPITGLNCYNNFTYIDPRVSASSESIQNVTGCSVTAGGVFAYFDWITGKNMWFAGGDGIGLDATTAGKWRSRLNINLGYYF